MSWHLGIGGICNSYAAAGASLGIKLVSAAANVSWHRKASAAALWQSICAYRRNKQLSVCVAAIAYLGAMAGVWRSLGEIKRRRGQPCRLAWLINIL